MGGSKRQNQQRKKKSSLNAVLFDLHFGCLNGNASYGILRGTEAETRPEAKKLRRGGKDKRRVGRAGWKDPLAKREYGPKNNDSRTVGGVKDTPTYVLHVSLKGESDDRKNLYQKGKNKTRMLHMIFQTSFRRGRK